MPIYEFACPSCHTVVERIQKYSDAPPLCSGNPFEPHRDCSTERIFSRSSFKVHGFNSMTGYASPRTIHMRRGNIKTTVSGNFEAFSERLTNS